jgi:hypothetical protein
MPLYADLTTEEQEIVNQATQFIRGFLRQMAASDLDLRMQWLDDNAVPLITSLDAGAVIPNVSGLAGAVDLTKEELTTLRNWINDINTDIQTNKSVLVKAIGVNA